MSIRRLERDTSVDRLSTGSRESNRSTQSEWVRGEKSKSKKNAGLIGKLKKLTRGMSAEREREFGSGSDIRDAVHFMSGFHQIRINKWYFPFDFWVLNS